MANVEDSENNVQSEITEVTQTHEEPLDTDNALFQTVTCGANAATNDLSTRSQLEGANESTDQTIRITNEQQNQDNVPNNKCDGNESKSGCFVVNKITEVANLFWNAPILLAVITSIAIALNVFNIKQLSDHYPVFEVVALRSLFLLFIIIFMMWRQKVSPFEPRNKMPLLILRGVTGSLAFTSSYFAAFLLPLSEASFLSNSYPVMTALLSRIFGMEELGLWSWFGITGCVAGNALVARPPFIFGGDEVYNSDRILGIGVAILSSVTMGLTFILVGRIGKRVHPLSIMMYQSLSIVLICIPFMSASYPSVPRLPKNAFHVFRIFLSTLASLISQSMVVRALQIGKATLVTSIVMTNMIIAAFLGITFLGEALHLVSSGGACLVLLSVIIVIVNRGAKKEENNAAMETKMDGEDLDNERELELPTSNQRGN
eukprot:g8133.t1